MKKSIVLLLILTLFVGCSESKQRPTSNSHVGCSDSNYVDYLAMPSSLKEQPTVISIHRGANPFPMTKIKELPNETQGFGIDVRYDDLSLVTLNGAIDMSKFSYSTRTVWPSELPTNFDPYSLIDKNKNPGLGIRSIHEMGYTGKSIGIAIIDQTLALDHISYKDRVKYYEEIHSIDGGSSMHGSGVTSIAAGKENGVAPDSDIYYIASILGDYDFNADQVSTVDPFDAAIVAMDIDRIIEVNSNLEHDKKIKVISISRGIEESDKNFNKFMEAVRRAEEENILVLTCNRSYSFQQFDIYPLERDQSGDPDNNTSYQLPEWIRSNMEYSNSEKGIAIPSGSLSYASFTSISDYELNPMGNASWTVPWLAGLYALACEANPELTAEKFIELMFDTSASIEVIEKNNSYNIEHLIQPVELIEAALGN